MAIFVKYHGVRVGKLVGTTKKGRKEYYEVEYTNFPIYQGTKGGNEKDPIFIRKTYLKKDCTLEVVNWFITFLSRLRALFANRQILPGHAPAQA